MNVHWKAGEVRGSDGIAFVQVQAVDETGKVYGDGVVRVTRRGLLAKTLLGGDGPPELPDSIKGAVGFSLGGLKGLQDEVARAARAAGFIPAADPEKEITGKPRILSFTEGCVVVVDDPVAIAKAVVDGRYNGPKDVPPNLEFVMHPAALPGRKYLNVMRNFLPFAPPNGQDLPADAVLTLEAGWATIWPSWTDADQAISEAYRSEVLKS